MFPDFTTSAASFEGLPYKAACRAFFCAHSSVLMETPSPFWRKSRAPFSSTMQMVTDTFWRAASASAATTIFLMAARFKYFFEGRSAAISVPIRMNAISSDLNMRRMVSMGSRFSKRGRPRPHRTCAQEPSCPGFAISKEHLFRSGVRIYGAWLARKIDTQAPSKNTPNASGLEALSVIALDFANSGFLWHLRVTVSSQPFQLHTASVETSALSICGARAATFAPVPGTSPGSSARKSKGATPSVSPAKLRLHGAAVFR